MDEECHLVQRIEAYHEPPESGTVKPRRKPGQKQWLVYGSTAITTLLVAGGIVLAMDLLQTSGDEIVATESISDTGARHWTTSEATGDWNQTTTEATGDRRQGTGDWNQTTTEATGDWNQTTTEATGDWSQKTTEATGDWKQTTTEATGDWNQTTTEATGEESTAVVSTPRPKLSPATDPYPLLCTVSNKFDVQSKVPPDGLCDLLFYDSLYRDDRNNLGGPYDEGVERFLALPGQMKTTQVGVSLDVEHRRFIDQQQGGPYNLVAEFLPGIDDLWNRGVSHFGILNIWNWLDLNRRWITTYLRILMAIYARVQSKAAQNRSPYTVIGIRFNNSPDSEEMLHMNLKYTKQSFKPSLYVAVSHVSFRDRQEKPCHIMPSTILKFPDTIDRSKITEGQSLMDVMFHLSWLVRSRISISMAVSFTMRARLYKPAKPDGGLDAYKAYEECQNHADDSDVPPVTLCGGSYDSEFRDLSTEASVMTHDIDKQRSATFETDDTLKKKVCATKGEYIDIPFGIAVYDVDYDVAGNGCAPQRIRAGDFKRVETLKALRDFVRDEFANARRLDDCLRVPV